MLVSRQGNIYLGQTFFNYEIDSLYKLDSKGKVLWRKKYILGEDNPYAQGGGVIYGGLYPIFNKDSIIIWGSLRCGEGCYTNNNIALSENDKLIKLSYLEKLESYGPGTKFIDKYGIFIKNGSTFLVYNPIKNAIEKDTNSRIKFASIYEEIYELDVLPNQDLLVIENNILKKFSARKTIWATINNLEKEKEKNSASFWSLAVVDALKTFIKLDVFTSDSSNAILKLIPENSDVAYIKDQTLFFTGKEGKVKVFAQSINGGEPYISPEFTVYKGFPFFSIHVEGGAIYPNRPVVLTFESVENISFKIDTVQGACQLREGKIVATTPYSENCWVSYSWTGTDIYASGNSIFLISVLDYPFIEDEDIGKNTVLFPNPLTQNLLSIKSPRENIDRINITNINGQKTELNMFQSTFQKGRFISDFEISENFNPGVYIVELFDKKGVIIKKEKLIIAR
ncbi:T9SS type A sorting domain-containing protein [Emticicia sp. C21]|uniref:T9SS type A sorting domain-containing protein n=1 Tax=Emticicia sp. C21 TaxID=2302915 RepID=UPI0013148F47|nr:T9SS type A sorting domain-containing protein [Emticicia sp. C21]